MLKTLSVTNFAIIDQLDIQFDQGLTTITGETGAGKSILLGALRLVLGERADLKSLKNTEEKCIIEANFSIGKLKLEAFFEENDLDYDAESILRRELLPSGKSRAFINDTPVTLNILQSLSEQLIDIHSQFNTQKLLEAEYQMQILDVYSSNHSLLYEYQTKYLKLAEDKKKLSLLKTKRATQFENLDFQKFLLEELIDADLKPNELEVAETELKELSAVDEIVGSLDEINQILEHPEIGILHQLGEISHRMNKIVTLSKDIENLNIRLSSIRIELDDVTKEILNKVEQTESNPERLQQLSDRLDLIHSLLRKHQCLNIEGVLEIQDKLKEETLSFDDSEVEINKLEKEITLQTEQLDILAGQLSKNRSEAIPKVEENIHETLSKVGMENAVLTIVLETKEDFTILGKDKVSFLFTANKGIEARSIEKAVSGGERSRLMLAIKKFLATHLQLQTLILDEIDTGISGKVANETAKVMQEMAKNLQLIVITHLPQVAAKGNAHLKVFKETLEETTQTQVKQLSEKERLYEIAQMISGSDVSDAALDQAKELIFS